MKKSILFGLILFLVPALILAQPPNKGKAESCGQEMKAGQGMNCWQPGGMSEADMLKLTDQQKADHKKIALKYQRLNIPLQSNLKLANLDLKEAMESLDQKKIDESVKKINDIKAELFKNRINQRVEFVKLLTAEQKTMLKNRPCGMRKMRKVMMKGPAGGCDMGVIDEDMNPSFGFGADLPPMDMDEEIEMEIIPEE